MTLTILAKRVPGRDLVVVADDELVWVELPANCSVDAGVSSMREMILDLSAFIAMIQEGKLGWAETKLSLEDEERLHEIREWIEEFPSPTGPAPIGRVLE